MMYILMLILYSQNFNFRKKNGNRNTSKWFPNLTTLLFQFFRERKKNTKTFHSDVTIPWHLVSQVYRTLIHSFPTKSIRICLYDFIAFDLLPHQFQLELCLDLSVCTFGHVYAQFTLFGHWSTFYVSFVVCFELIFGPFRFFFFSSCRFSFSGYVNQSILKSGMGFWDWLSVLEQRKCVRHPIICWTKWIIQ